LTDTKALRCLFLGVALAVSPRQATLAGAPGPLREASSEFLSAGTAPSEGLPVESDWMERVDRAETNMRRGLYREAAQEFRAVYKFVRVAFPTDTRRVAIAHDLALALLNLGHAIQAMRVLTTATQAVQALLPADEPFRYRIAAARGRCRLELGDLEGGLEELSDAVHHLTAVDGMGAVYRIEALLLQGQALVMAADTGKAWNVAVEAEDLARRVHGMDHPGRAKALNLLGFLEMSPHPDRAEIRFDEAWSIFQSRFPDGHPDAIPILTNKGLLALARSDGPEAQVFFKQAYDIATRFLPPAHPTGAMSAANLAHGLINIGKDNEARPLFASALEILENRLGKDHISLAPILDQLAALDLRLSRLEEARAEALRSLRIHEDHQGNETVQLVSALFTLASLEAGENRISESLEFLDRGLRLQAAVGGAGSPVLLSGLGMKANLLYQGGRVEDARVVAKEIREICHGAGIEVPKMGGLE